MTDELDWILLHYGGYCCGQVEASDVDKQFFEAKQAIQALIDRECTKARINELSNLVSYENRHNRSASGKGLKLRPIYKRIAELTKDTK